MATKDINKNTKTSLMDELKSIKGVLDTDDDNVPLLLDDDVPILEDSEDDVPLLLDNDDEIPVLTDPEAIDTNKASLEAAIRQLESMELSPKAGKTSMAKPGIEEKIRANAAPPLIKDDRTQVRENPFLKKKASDSFAESRKQAEEALKAVISHSRAIAKPGRQTPPEEPRSAMVSVKDSASDGAIEFTDNQFLKSSAPISTAAPTSSDAAKQKASPAVEKDGSEDILKLLNEETPLDLDLGEGFGELVDIDVDALIAEKTPPAKPAAPQKPAASTPLKNKSTEKELDQLVDEVIDEYMIILEAALKKKLKEKLPDLLKK